MAFMGIYICGSEKHVCDNCSATVRDNENFLDMMRRVKLYSHVKQSDTVSQINNPLLNWMQKD